MSVYIIAEAGVNHNGDIGLAKALIDMAHKAGANAIKFQTFKAEESTSVFAEKADYQKTEGLEETQLDMIRKLQLPFEAFDELKRYAERIGIDFISTPDGKESLEYLMKLDVPLIKVGSTEVTNHPFLVEIAKTGKKIILSTGMSTLGEVESAINVLVANGCSDLELLHCTTAYPTNVEDVNLLAIVTMREAFKIPVGLSDHTTSPEAAIAAVALGAKCIEKHITLDKELPGPDHRASMNLVEFSNYVGAIRRVERLLGDGVKRPTPSEELIMKNVRRSILASRRLDKGTVLTEDMLCFKRPGDGIYPECASNIIGMRINRDIEKEEKILWEDLKA